MKHIIILEKDGKLESWGSLTRACDNHPDFQYHTIKILDFPFEHKGYVFQKVIHNTKNHE